MPCRTERYCPWVSLCCVERKRCLSPQGELFLKESDHGSYLLGWSAFVGRFVRQFRRGIENDSFHRGSLRLLSRSHPRHDNQTSVLRCPSINLRARCRVLQGLCDVLRRLHDVL